ncbi:MAG TPA: glycosyltransferase family 39 protein [Ignavibacteria bacterium]|nr:glycosyltransferase family 39 protein [Ignavibacteria bacterium]HMR41355.1 glycosyltransferase family 39 protein [Ignavibacteria bacterium]
MKENPSSFKLSKDENILLFTILTGTFIVKIIFAIFIQSPIRSDSADYLELASSILKGEYSFSGKPTAYVGCGYPLFLSAVLFFFGDGQFYIRVIQSAIEIGTGYLFFRISRNFFNVKYSLISLLVFSLLPSNIIFSQAVLSESLFGFFSMAVLYLVMREDFPEKRSLIFITGLLFGYAVLIRTAYLPCIILIPLYFYVFRNELHGDLKFSKAVKLSLVFIAGVIMVIAPWSIRNKIQVNTFSLGTTSGVNFWAGSNPDATGTYYQNMTESFPIDFHNEADRDKEYFKLGMDYAVSNPGKYFVLGIKKLGYLFSSERMAVLYFTDAKPGESSTEVYRSVNPIILILVNFPYFFVMLTGVWGLLFLKEKKFFIIGFTFIWVITVFIFVALARYHFVLIPFFTIGCVNFLSDKDLLFKEMSLFKKISGAVISLFFISVWIAEFYLMYK